MGCSKNLVDSEHLMRQLEASGFEPVHDAPLDAAEVVVVNTCGFIHDAREESVDMILQCVEAKNEGMIEHLFVIGCLSELYKKDLEKEIPEVDRYFGAKNIEEVVRALTGNYYPDLRTQRVITTPRHYAYLKIGEGCNRTCAFCSIPYIRGPHISRSVEDILEEARFLASEGVKELLVISQDITYYGQDLYRRQMLPELVARLCEIDEIEWVRLHYTYPVRFPMEVVDLMRDERKICRYIDIPVQHASDRVLTMMRRNITAAETSQLITEIRNRVPGIALRTTMIVGHPGETDEDFARLVDFVEQTRFERLGVFTYSHEENTYAAKHYKDTIPDAVKQERADHIMEIQKKISEELNREKVGKIYKTLIDRMEGEFYVGRTEYDSPEVDMEVLIPRDSQPAEIGRFYPVLVTDADEFDLYGKFTGQKE
ncbi:MAG: 30S ribosomal protein S12 methylthiotransferase RimO [Bacteroidales bacterium]|jgi:ribosomal protein S12 methylthiotransferase|nr:30S ribosomal protein S12 methylthiotransferase RimO [Bacteroidales bacterium]